MHFSLLLKKSFVIRNIGPDYSFNAGDNKAQASPRDEDSMYFASQCKHFCGVSNVLYHV